MYRNLEELVECGAASKLTYGDGSARYDIRTDQHYHTRCIGCGKVSDLEAEKSPKWLHQIAKRTTFEVIDFRLELLGYCEDCES